MAIFMSIWHYQVIFCNIFIAFVSTTWQKYQMNGCKVLFGAIGFELNFKKKQLMSASILPNVKSNVCFASYFGDK